MSKSTKKVIKYFSDRFLDVEEYPKEISEVCGLPLDAFKNFDGDIIKKLNKLEINTIEDFASLSDKKAENLIKTNRFDSSKFRKALIGARLISKSLEKREGIIRDDRSKVVITGLNKAGKKTFIKQLLKVKSISLGKEGLSGGLTTYNGMIRSY